MRNKYPGKCVRCGCEVAAGAGHPERRNGAWAVRCKPCVGKPVERVLHEGPAVMFMRCGGREPTHQRTKITVTE